METKKSKLTDLIIGIILSVMGLAGVITGYVIDLKRPSVFVKPAWYTYTAYILGGCLLFIGVFFIISYIQKRIKIKKLTVKQMCIISVQAGITVVLYYYAKFNLPIFPSWLDIQVSEIPALVTSFIYGPFCGSMVIILRFIVKLPGSMTMGIGEVADLILGLTLVITSGTIYKKHRTLKGAIAGSAIGMLLATILACLSNWLVLIPAYIKLCGFSYEMLVGMWKAVNFVTVDNFMLCYIFVGVLPFNIFRYIIVLAITFVIYKKLHVLFDRIAGSEEEIEE